MLINYPILGDAVRRDGEILQVKWCGVASINVLGYGPIPVQFTDGTYGLVSIQPAVKVRPTYHARLMLAIQGEDLPGCDEALTAWVPDTPIAALALRNAAEMPEVRHGIGSDVYHVRVTTKEGRKLIKMFYNQKKMAGRSDKLYSVDAEGNMHQEAGDRIVMARL